MSRIIREVLRNKERPVRPGTIWTTDAPYRETAEKVRAYGERGILGVEMEMSALMAVAAYRRIRMAGLLVVSDELFEMRWRSGFSSAILRESSLFAREALLDAVRAAAENCEV
jgi:purine-nucleoside phosphorylase